MTKEPRPPDVKAKAFLGFTIISAAALIFSLSYLANYAYDYGHGHGDGNAQHGHHGHNHDQEAPLLGGNSCSFSDDLPSVYGAASLGNGYNIVTGEDADGASRLLATDTYDQKIAKVFAFSNRGAAGTQQCFKVPDALATDNDQTGVDPAKSKWETEFDAISSTSTERFRRIKATTSKDEYSQKGGFFEVVSTEAAYSKSKEVKQLREQEQTKATNAMSLSTVGQIYEARVINPNPTAKAQQAWVKLAMDGSEADFTGYFIKFGTHYYAKASIGGRYWIAFRTDTNNRLPWITSYALVHLNYILFSFPCL
jgi:hypothetical protein